MSIRKFLARLVSRLLANEPQPSGVYACCLASKAGQTNAGYALHRVRFHGEGSA